MDDAGAAHRRRHLLAAVVAIVTGVTGLLGGAWQVYTVIKLVGGTAEWPWFVLFLAAVAVGMIPSVLLLVLARPLGRGVYAAWLAMSVICSFILLRMFSGVSVFLWLAANYDSFTLGAEYWSWFITVILTHAVLLAFLAAARHGLQLRHSGRAAAGRLRIVLILAAAASFAASAGIALSMRSYSFGWLSTGTAQVKALLWLTGGVNVILGGALLAAAVWRPVDPASHRLDWLAGAGLILMTVQSGLSTFTTEYFGIANVITSLLLGWALVETVLARRTDGDLAHGFEPIMPAAEVHDG